MTVSVCSWMRQGYFWEETYSEQPFDQPGPFWLKLWTEWSNPNIEDSRQKLYENVKEFYYANQRWWMESEGGETRDGVRGRRGDVSSAGWLFISIPFKWQDTPFYVNRV